MIKLASNENPFGPSPLALEAIRKAAAEVNLYPDNDASELRQALAARHQLLEGADFYRRWLAGDSGRGGPDFTRAGDQLHQQRALFHQLSVDYADHRRAVRRRSHAE